MEIKSVLLFSLIIVQNFSQLLSIGQSSNPFHNGPSKNGGFLGRWITDSLINSARKEYTPIKNVNFYLYTAKNPYIPQQLFAGNTKSVELSNFDKNNPTRILIHGFMSNAQQEVNFLIRDAYLSTGPQNIIVVDWSEKSFSSYQIAAESVSDVGKRVGIFIDFMKVKFSVDLKNVTLVGHSLGAHVCGNAARSLKSGLVHTIIAMDPASVLFPYDSSVSRLRSTDAYYVESIQTNGGFTGYVEPIGKATFYPNGGKKQPGCEFDPFVGCPHFRAYKFFAEAIKINGFPSIQCSRVEDAWAEKCGKQFSTAVRMGAPGNADIASEIFSVPTKSSSPYAFSHTTRL